MFLNDLYDFDFTYRGSGLIFGSVISGLAMGGIMGLIELITNTGGILRRRSDQPYVPISAFPKRYRLNKRKKKPTPYFTLPSKIKYKMKKYEKEPIELLQDLKDYDDYEYYDYPSYYYDNDRTDIGDLP